MLSLRSSFFLKKFSQIVVFATGENCMANVWLFFFSYYECITCLWRIKIAAPCVFGDGDNILFTFFFASYYLYNNINKKMEKRRKTASYVCNAQAERTTNKHINITIQVVRMCVLFIINARWHPGAGAGAGPISPEIFMCFGQQSAKLNLPFSPCSFPSQSE